ncbi:MAG: serine hydrolase domain-containing protein [Terracidiphilus sp.]
MTTLVLCVLASLVVLPGQHRPSAVDAAGSAQVETPARRELGRWLAAFDNSDRATYRAFLEHEFPAGLTHIDRDTGLWENTGGFDLKKIETESPTQITALVEERAGDDFARITLQVNPAAPARIARFQIVPVYPRPAGFPLPHLSDAQLIARLRTRLSNAVAAGRFSGAVLVAKDGKPIFARAYGLADRERHTPNTLETQFSIGSMNKMFTAVAILQLVQAGKMKLDDPLAKFLPTYPNHKLAATVTIRELLTNSGGTGDIWGPEYDQHRLQLRTLADYVRLYGDRPLRFPPGSRWEYSNYGFILLGRVIEVVSGESYYAYVREHVYAPAGMRATASPPEDEPDALSSVGYTRQGTGQWHSTAGMGSYRGTSAGGGLSTVGDLLRFANALEQHTLLNAQLTRMATTGQEKNPFGYDGFGFGVQSFNGTPCFGHNGAGAGANGDLEMCGNGRYAVIVLSNLDPPSAQQISEFILDRLPLRP